MAKQSSVNLDITNNADGFDISGGTTVRKLGITGGDVTIAGSGSATVTFPTTSTTIAGLGITQSFSALQSFSAGISAAGGVTFSGNISAPNIVNSFNGSTGTVTGVSSIRGITGTVGITNGTGIGLSVSGQTMTFSNTGVLSINGSTGDFYNIVRSGATTAFSILPTIAFGTNAQYTNQSIIFTEQYDYASTTLQSSPSGFSNTIYLPNTTTGTIALTNGTVASFNGKTGAVQGVSAAVGSTYLTVSGSTGSVTFTNTGVQTFNGLTGTVTGVTVGGTNVFTALNTFNAGLSGDINISSTNASGNVMYLLMARGTGVTGVFIDNVTTPLIYNPFQGNLGLKGITLSTGSDSLSILPGSVTANNSTNNAYFYFIANGGNYFQSPVLSQIGDIGGVNSALALNVDPSSRTMTWSDGVYLTGVTSGFFGVNRSPYGMLSDYAVEINSPTGKGIQLMYNDYTGAVSNSVKMDVSSAGNYTVLPSGGLATITGTLNVSAGISASGATFSGNVAMTSTSSHTGLASFVGGLSAAGSTFSGNVNLQDNTLSRIELLDYCERFVDLGDFASKGSPIPIDLSTGQVFRTKYTLAGSGLSVTNVPDNANANTVGFTLLFVGDGTARTMTWNIGSTAIGWAGGIAPTYTSTLNKIDVYSFLTRDGGSNWLGFVGGQNF
jgi:hypothetical protein